MTRTIVAVAAVALALGAAPAYAQTSYGTTTTTTTQSGSTKISKADENFIKKVAQDGIAEVDLATLAKEHAKSDQVKTFAERMIKDHTKANQELERIAQNDGVAIPGEAGEEHSKMRAELSKFKGEEFDQRYMKEMVEAHQKAVSLLEQETKTVDNKDLKAFAEATLPVVKEHLQMAKATVQQAQVQ
jgi:putative membrane protein